MKTTAVRLGLGLALFGPLASLAESAAPPAKSAAPTAPEDEGKKWPRTLDEAATRALAMFSDANKKALRTAPFGDLLKFHNTLGATLRNAFGLWRGNRPLQDDCNAKNPDEASLVILEEVWARLQKENK